MTCKTRFKMTRGQAAVTVLTALGIGATSCTGQIPGSLRFAQQEQTFGSTQDINTKIDLLFVVDNSSSMDVNQQKLRNGFASFAQKYMQPTWDIHVAVITTDTYLAHPAYQSYLNSVIPNTVGNSSPYVSSRLATFVNPSYNPTLVNLSTGKFDNGVKIKDLVPSWGPNLSKLLANTHDGPTTAFCMESLPYFLNGQSNCKQRDAATANTGTYNCLHPNSANGETSITQCVNTIENDTVHSHKAIISTMPPTPLTGSALTAWTNQLVDDFMVNVSTGSSGHGSERGMQSVLQLIADNEGTSTAFFRQNSVRAIIFLSDEEDQTMNIEASPPANFGPFSHYACDQAGIVAMNGASFGQAGGYCCSGGTCTFGAEGTSCASKTIDGYTYTIGICPLDAYLMPVATVKGKLDTFFSNLDGATDPNYFIASIVPLTGAAIQSMQTARYSEDNAAAGGFKLAATDRGDRYIALGNLVGNGSMAMDMSSSDYTPILNAIGAAIIAKKSTFTLQRAPSSTEEMLITIVHADGSKTVIPSSSYVISGKSIIITDQSIVLGFASTDKISINYQPKTQY